MRYTFFPEDDMPEWSWHVLEMAFGGLMAFWGAYRAIEKKLERVDRKLEILETKVSPLITWWNRSAQAAADRLFSRAAKANGGLQ